MQYFLGIDVGTTGTKTLLFNADGKLLGDAYESYPLLNQKVGCSEQNPHDWWHAICSTVRTVCNTKEIAENTMAISLSLQGGTLVCVGENGEPVRPAIVWNDQRAETAARLYAEQFEASSLYQKTGWSLGASLPLMQIREMKENEPELFKKTAMFLTVPDYVSLKMTGIAACDYSDAGINQFCQIREEKYDPELLQFAGITEKQLPKLVKSGEVIGHLTEKAAEEMGLTTKCVLAAGAHDQYAVALGAGANNDGDIMIGSGTCWVITAIGAQPDFSGGLAQSKACAPGKWGSILSLPTGGVCLEWLRKTVSGKDILGYDEINRGVASRRAAEDGLFFFPFQGMASAEQSFQKASFFGLDLSHDRFHMARAIMEGVCFQAMWMIEKFREKPSKDGLILAGGASKSRVWAQILANIADLPIRVPAVANLACVGAGIMAGMACGAIGSIEEGCKKLDVGTTVILPQPEEVAKYRPLTEKYRQIAALLGKAYQI